MKFGSRLFVVVSILFALAVTFASSNRMSIEDASAQNEKIPGNKFVYADFEKTENARPVSNGGGMVQIYTAQESTPVKFKGLANASPGAPELVRTKPDDPNHLAAFEYNLTSPNQWANVTLEIQGHAYKDGKPVADDVTGYKNLALQIYATGTDALRIEFVSHGQGIKINNGFPQIAIKLKPGLNTYLIPLKSPAQPPWAEDKIDTKEVLKKLTSVSISAYCNQCSPQHGTVLVDNLIFQK